MQLMFSPAADSGAYGYGPGGIGTGGGSTTNYAPGGLPSSPAPAPKPTVSPPDTFDMPPTTMAVVPFKGPVAIDRFAPIDFPVDVPAGGTTPTGTTGSGCSGGCGLKPPTAAPVASFPVAPETDAQHTASGPTEAAWWSTTWHGLPLWVWVLLALVVLQLVRR